MDVPEPPEAFKAGRVGVVRKFESCAGSRIRGAGVSAHTEGAAAREVECRERIRGADADIARYDGAVCRRGVRARVGADGDSPVHVELRDGCSRADADLAGGVDGETKVIAVRADIESAFRTDDDGIRKFPGEKRIGARAIVRKADVAAGRAAVRAAREGEVSAAAVCRSALSRSLR